MFAVPVFGSPRRLLATDIRYRLLLCRESLGRRMEEGCLCCGAAVYMDYLQLDLMIFVVFSSLSHRITERPGLQRSTVLIPFQPPAMCRVANQQPRLPRATSSLALNACRDGASTASLGNLFQ